MKTVIKLSGVLFLIGLILFACSCSKPHYGCKKREQRKSAKHFNKSVNWCSSEAMRQSLVHFPFKESDSTFSETETKVDTFTRYDTLVENDTVYIIKYVDRIVNKVTTNTKEVRVEDGRRVGLLENELAIASQKEADMAVELSEMNAKVASEKSAKNVYKWLLIWILVAIAAIFGVKFVIPKILR